MKMSFRWYGPSDPITLSDIRQIPGMKGIVSSCFEVPADEVVSVAKFQHLKDEVESHGMELVVIESIPVHEEIKLGGAKRDEYIEIWLQSVRNMAEVGIPVVCYNFMLAFDWLRTDLRKSMGNGAYTMFYNEDDLAQFDFTREIPAWSQKYTPETLQTMLDRSRALSEEQLWENLEYFLKRVVPVVEKLGVKMAIHPDDPPFPVMGIPRLMTCQKNLQRFLDCVDSPANGLAFCTGSLGAGLHNQVEEMLEHFAPTGRVHFMHVRNLKHESEKHFYETAHPSSEGRMDMFRVMKALHDAGYKGPLRPDHGRDIWGEERTPGYGLYDRALGATYLQGLWEALEKR